MRRSAAFAGIRCIKSQSHKSVFCQMVSIKSGSLFFDTSGRMYTDYGRIMTGRDKILREKEITNQYDVVTPQERDFANCYTTCRIDRCHHVCFCL